MHTFYTNTITYQQHLKTLKTSHVQLVRVDSNYSSHFPTKIRDDNKKLKEVNALTTMQFTTPMLIVPDVAECDTWVYYTDDTEDSFLICQTKQYQ